MNKSDWDSSDIIFKRKICIYLARGPGLANVTKKLFLKFILISFLVTDKGLVEILNLHRKWKNEKTKNIVLFQNRLWRELCFWKCKISLHLKVLEFKRQEKIKKCKQDFIKTLIFLSFLCELHSLNYFWGQNMINMYTPSVFRDNLSIKRIPTLILCW